MVPPAADGVLIHWFYVDALALTDSCPIRGIGYDLSQKIGTLEP
jgi:hypothetical protein